MKIKSIFTLGTVALWSLFPLKSYGQNWVTVLDYQFVTGASSGGECLTADSSGRVFAGGLGYTSPSYGSGLVLDTDTTEAKWYLVDDQNPSPSQDQSEVTGLAFDSLGNLYSAGVFNSACTATGCPGWQWYIRMSSDAGASWATVDLFQYAAGQNSLGRLQIASDLSGQVYVVGSAIDANGVGHWLVRKGSNAGKTWSSVDDINRAGGLGIGFVPNVGLFACGYITTTTGTKGKVITTSSWVVRRSLDSGATWSTVDVVQPPTGYGAHGAAVVCDAAGNIYVAGVTTTLVTTGRTTTGVSAWLVRESRDNGNTWSTVDAFSYVTGKKSISCTIGRDSVGNPVVAGSGTDASGNQHWLVRRPIQGSWQTVDDYQLAAGQKEAVGLGVVADTAGNLLVTGGANDSTGVTHWVVRRTNP